MVQEQILSKILTTKDLSILSLNNLTDKYFFGHVSEFNFILNHQKQYGCVPDVDTFSSVFPEFTVLQVSEADSYLLQKLFEEFRAHELAATFNKVRSLLLEGKSEEALKIYTQSSEVLSTVATSLNSVSLIHDVSRYDEYLNKIDNFNKYYISTGIKELDELIGGWDREEELATIIARTNQGKSWILLKCAVAAVRQGLVVGLYSGEMSEDKVGYRFDTLVSHISNGSLIHGNADVRGAYTDYIKDLPNKFSGDLKVLTPKNINGPATVSALRSFIEKEHLDVLFIDQHSLLEDDKNAKNPVERAADISRDLKNLQVMKRIPIITVSQMNRTKLEDTSSDYIDSTQIAQSDRIGQDSTTIIGLLRDKKDNTLLKMQIVKSRDSSGVGKQLSYIVDFNIGSFTFVPEAPNPGSYKDPNSDNLANRYTETSDVNDESFNDSESEEEVFKP